MKVELALPVYGGDLLCANAGRVSYDRWHDELTERDGELIEQFADEGDSSPFYHSVATFRITAPMPVIRQLTRHTVGFSNPNEVSRRYTSRNIVVERPEVWRSQDGVIFGEMAQAKIKARYETAVQLALDTYEWMIEHRVAREQARFVIPQGILVTVLWTGNVHAWYAVVKKRADPRAQLETQEVAWAIDEILAREFPIAWPALMANLEKAWGMA